MKSNNLLSKLIRHLKLFNDNDRLVCFSVKIIKAFLPISPPKATGSICMSCYLTRAHKIRGRWLRHIFLSFLALLEKRVHIWILKHQKKVFFFFLLYFFHYHLVPYAPFPHNHHTIVHVRESFFLFAHISGDVWTVTTTVMGISVGSMPQRASALWRGQWQSFHFHCTSQHGEGLNWNHRQSPLSSLFHSHRFVLLFGHTMMAGELLPLFFKKNCLPSSSCTCFFHRLLPIFLTSSLTYMRNAQGYFNMHRDLFRLQCQGDNRIREFTLTSCNNTDSYPLLWAEVCPPKSICWCPNSQYHRVWVFGGN